MHLRCLFPLKILLNRSKSRIQSCCACEWQEATANNVNTEGQVLLALRRSVEEPPRSRKCFANAPAHISPCPTGSDHDAPQFLIWNCLQPLPHLVSPMPMTSSVPSGRTAPESIWQHNYEHEPHWCRNRHFLFRQVQPDHETFPRHHTVQLGNTIGKCLFSARTAILR